MSPRPAPTQDDEALRQALAQALQQARAPAEHSDAVQQRVLADWQARTQQALQHRTLPQTHQPLAAAPMPHAAGASLGGPARPHLPGGGGLHNGLTPLRRGLASGLLVLGLAAAAAWWLRPDPVLSELLQPDVLSQMGLGEL